ncbi:glycosyltransferase family 2 protein [Herbiconiux sp. SYSU D00978]|uniref:glycosyltransferase family 2 protein n=1 Tax=Herbiconiux sp. SYSU D00978 TaxID=2812562 RepID=UPI001A963924|nr:glycosyltransferase family 2 protein [Herbiconiux sp. SYSU D00978]
MTRILVVRILVFLTIVLGVNYVAWRWLASVNWEAWWIAVPLVAAETYSLIDVILFGVTVWRIKKERPKEPMPDGRTVDVFIATYNEPIELVMTTARAAKAIRYPHRTWVLDDGDRPELKRAAEAAGIGYITRSPDWAGRPRHAKAGNLNNALMSTDGEFLLILDADQIPVPEILDETLPYFHDEKVALVQTPQVFSNVATGDPLGSQAPLFYGPIQEGKDGWNAAFFCGSNAVLRREALMQLGIRGYVADVEATVAEALDASATALRRARRRADALATEVLTEAYEAVRQARRELRSGVAFGELTFRVQERVRQAERRLVDRQLAAVRDDLAALGLLEPGEDETQIDLEAAVDVLASRELSPLGALGTVAATLNKIDVSRSHEAQPVLPVATISVTEDMATSMRMHASGWSSRFHSHTLAYGLAPEDLGTMLTQRLRWAQGTMQVMLKENPLFLRGLSLGQKLMYFSTMWSYLGGFATIVYIAAPVAYLCFGVMPVDAWNVDFFVRFIPFFIINQFLFLAAARGAPTWRGQQYSFALFPVWIRAVTSAVNNVWFGRELGFSVTKKTRDSEHRNQWGLVRWQIAAAVVLAVSAIVGVIRLTAGLGEPIGTFVNVVWIIFDMVILSVLVWAVRYDGYDAAQQQQQQRKEQEA